MNKDLMVFSGNSNKELSKKIAKKLGIKLGKLHVEKFSDGESFARFGEGIRGKDIYLIQSLNQPVNDNLMELLVMIDAAKRASAGRINAIIPYYAYSRQDRSSKAREPISAKLVADLLQTAGADRVITMDIHAAPILGFFNVPCEHLFASDKFADYIKKKKLKNLCIVAPDVGAVKKAKMFAKELDADMAIIVKHRPKAEEVEAINVIGDIKGKNCVILDDLINTGGTIKLATEMLKQNGALDVYVMATHGVFAKQGLDKVLSAPIKEVVVTDTIPQEKRKGLVVLSVADVFAKAITVVNKNKSVSHIFTEFSL